MADPIAVIPPRVSFIDKKTGDISHEWFLLIAAIIRRIGGPNGYGSDDLALGALVGNNTPNLETMLLELMVGAQPTPTVDLSVLTALGVAPAVDHNTAAALPVAPAIADYSVGDVTPVKYVGTLGEQNADHVAITGGTIGLDAGTVALPSFYLGGDRSTGLYRPAADQWSFSIAGNRLLNMSAQRLTVDGRVSITAGSAALPSLYFGTDTTTGWYRSAADRWTFSVTGTPLINLTTGVLSVFGDIFSTNDIAATRQLVSLVGTGTAPLLVSSGTLVPNLYVARAAASDNASALVPVGSAYPSTPTPLTTAAACAAIDTLITIMQSRGL